jgi:hypothetical protein
MFASLTLFHTVEFQPVMVMDDLLNAGSSIEKAVKKFG